MRKLAAAFFAVIAMVALLSAGSLASAQSGTRCNRRLRRVGHSCLHLAESFSIIFRETDTDYMGDPDGQWHHMTASLSQDNIDSMLASLEGISTRTFAVWSAGAVQWDVDVRYAPRPITRMSTPDSNHQQWVRSRTASRT